MLPPWLVSPGGRVREARGPRGERISLEHDARGRVVERRVERRGFRVRVWRYSWDGRDRLVGCTTPEGAAWRYGYDPFGRRVWKVRRDVPFADGSVGTTYAWDGDVVAQAAPLLADGSVAWDQAVTWHFEPGGFVPLAREGSGRLHHVVTDHLGTPRELFAEDGALAWACQRHLWGGVRRVEADNDNRGFAQRTVPGGAVLGNVAYRLEEKPSPDAGSAFCPLGFQGQWWDGETGLFYNRFRYYDPLTAQYISADPIGLEGGLRTHAYVPAPNLWVDPLGLNSAILRRNLVSIGEGLDVPWQAHHVIPEQVWGRYPDMLGATRLNMDASANGIALPRDVSDGVRLGLPSHSNNHPSYSSIINTEVERVDAQWTRDKNSKDPKIRGCADARARERILAIQATNKGLLRGGNFGIGGRLR